MKKNNYLVSIIIRVKNEEKWILSCLRSVFNQSHKNIEVIIVDNYSTDKTVIKAKEFKVRMIKLKKYKPGLAINKGIRISKGKIIVVLSAHCIPVNIHWLSNLIKPLLNKNVAGVYGRQQPLSYSSDYDKRELITIFGLDKKIQKNDPFFHNANSAFLKQTWKKFKFDENVNSIEDRLWGEQVISNNLKIIYEPKASVYHYHGIYQNLNSKRLKNTVKVLEKMSTSKNIEKLNNKKNKIICIIPIRGKLIKINKKYLIEYTIKSALKSKFIDHLFVATDNERASEIVKSLGADSSFLRPKSMSEDFIDESEILNFVISNFEKKRKYFNIVVCLKETYPFRSYTVIDDMISSLIEKRYDTIVAVKKEKRTIWNYHNKNISLISEYMMPRSLKEDKSFISLAGLGYVTRSDIIKNINVFSKNVGLFEIKNFINTIEYKDLINSKLKIESINNIMKNE